MLRARLYYAAIGFRYDGLRGARHYWRRFSPPKNC